MRTVAELKTIFEKYSLFANGLPKTSALKKFLQGGYDSPEYHPGHQAFFDEVGAWTKDFAAREPSQEERLQALEILLLTAAEHTGKAPYWYMVAAQRHALPLISGLEEEKREVLARKFRACYPHNTQLPVQQEAEKLLRGGKTRSLWEILLGK